MKRLFLAALVVIAATLFAPAVVRASPDDDARAAFAFAAAARSRTVLVPCPCGDACTRPDGACPGGCSARAVASTVAVAVPVAVKVCDANGCRMVLTSPTATAAPSAAGCASCGSTTTTTATALKAIPVERAELRMERVVHHAEVVSAHPILGRIPILRRLCR